LGSLEELPFAGIIVIIFIINESKSIPRDI